VIAPEGRLAPAARFEDNDAPMSAAPFKS